MIGDPELLRQYFENSSEKAFAELVRRHVDFVYGVAFRVARNAHRAEDATQMVFTELARKAGDLSRRTELVGWLYTCTCYVAAKIVRSEVRREAREREAPMIAESLAEHSLQINWQRLAPLLDDALGGLRAIDQSAILLRFFKNLSFTDIGSSLNLTEDAARKRVDRALDKLRGSLLKRGITSTSAALAAILASQVGIAAPAGLSASVTAIALAHLASGGATTTIGAITIMTTTKVTGGIAVLLGIFAIGLAVHQSHTTALLLQYKMDRDRLQRELVAAENRERALVAGIAGMERRQGSSSTTANQAASTTTAKAIGTGSYFGFPRAILNDPVKRKAYIAADAAMFASRLGSFFVAAGISHDQRSQILSTRMEDLNEQMDLAETAQGEGIPDSDPGLTAQIGQIQASINGQISSAIGDSSFQQYQQAMATIPQRNVADELASVLYYTPNPLTGAQADQLVSILSAQNGGTVLSRSYEGFGTRSAIITDQAIAQVQGVLSAQQVAALQELQQLQKDPVLPVIPANNSQH